MEWEDRPWDKVATTTRPWAFKFFIGFSAFNSLFLIKVHGEPLSQLEPELSANKAETTDSALPSLSTSQDSDFQDQCIPKEDLFLEVGYYLNPEQKKWLTTRVWTPQSQSLESNELLRKIRTFIGNHNSRVQAEPLSRIILQAARSVGIDPLIFTALIRVESIFRPQAVSPTGAVGLTQMTTIAMSELRNQFGVGDPKFRASSRDDLIQMVDQFFNQNRRKTEEYLNFIAKSKDPSYYRPILLSNQEYSILTGALLFKLKLAVARGNYTRVIEAYNGSKIQNKYRAEVLRYRDDVKKVSLECLDTRLARQVFAWSCLIHTTFEKEHTPSSCYRDDIPRIVL